MTNKNKKSIVDFASHYFFAKKLYKDDDQLLEDLTNRREYYIKKRDAVMRSQILPLFLMYILALLGKSFIEFIEQKEYINFSVQEFFFDPDKKYRIILTRPKVLDEFMANKGLSDDVKITSISLHTLIYTRLNPILVYIPFIVFIFLNLFVVYYSIAEITISRFKSHLIKQKTSIDKDRVKYWAITSLSGGAFFSKILKNEELWDKVKESENVSAILKKAGFVKLISNASGFMLYLLHFLPTFIFMTCLWFIIGFGGHSTTFNLIIKISLMIICFILFFFPFGWFFLTRAQFLGASLFVITFLYFIISAINEWFFFLILPGLKLPTPP